MSKHDELPKLYRAVYVNIEWLEDSDYGGMAHCQSSGQFSVKIKRVLNEINEPIFVCAEAWMKDHPDVVSYLDELNYYGADDFDFKWSHKAYKYIPCNAILTPYGS